MYKKVSMNGIVNWRKCLPSREPVDYFAALFSSWKYTKIDLVNLNKLTIRLKV
jgi:hypothetical protein